MQKFSLSQAAEIVFAILSPFAFPKHLVNLFSDRDIH